MFLILHLFLQFRDHIVNLVYLIPIFIFFYYTTLSDICFILRFSHINIDSLSWLFIIVIRLRLWLTLRLRLNYWILIRINFIIWWIHIGSRLFRFRLPDCLREVWGLWEVWLIFFNNLFLIWCLWEVWYTLFDFIIFLFLINIILLLILNCLILNWRFAGFNQRSLFTELIISYTHALPAIYFVSHFKILISTNLWQTSWFLTRLLFI